MTNNKKKYDYKNWWKKFYNPIQMETYLSLSTDNDTQIEVDVYEKLLNLRIGVKILDLGCGFGRHAIELARRGYQVTGIDYSSSYLKLAIETAKEKNVKLDFLRQDIKADPISGKFSAIIIRSAFGFFNKEEDLMILKKIQKNLTKDGLILFDNPNPYKIKHDFIKEGRKLNNKRYIRTFTNIVNKKIVVKNFGLFDSKSNTEYDKFILKNGTDDEIVQYGKMRHYLLPDYKELFNKSSLKIKKINCDYYKNQSLLKNRILVIAAPT